ncbi:MAG: rhodanese-like domain-containing protein [Cyclobacteriaceae bacterium]
MNINEKIIVLLITLHMVAVSFFQDKAPAIVRNVSAEEFKKLMDSLPDEVVVDLRTAEEIKGGKVAGSTEIDFFGQGFEPAIAALDRNKVYLLYCAAGGRSGKTAELMAKMGFKNLYNMEGGFRQWQKLRMPVSKQ